MTDLATELRRLAAATDPADDPVTLEELRQRTGSRRAGRAALVAAVVLLVAGIAAGMALSAPDAADAPADRPTTEPPVATPDPGQRPLVEADPVVQAVLALLPEGATFDAATDVRAARPGGADYVQVRASAGPVEYEVSVHRHFDEDELSAPDLVPGGKAWPGATGPEYSYLYFLSDADVGMYLAVSGPFDGDAATTLMDLARRVVADPVLSTLGVDDPLSGPATDGPSDGPGRVSPEALDLLAPVDREAFHDARSRLNLAVWETVEPEWSACIQRDGFTVDADLGFELSSYGSAAAYDFVAPSVITDQGGSGRTSSAAAAELTADEAASVERCERLSQSVLEGQPPTADGVDDGEVAAARRALEILGSDTSTFPRLYAEIERRVDAGAWQPVVECLRDRPFAIPDAAADSPNATLDVLGIAVDGSQSPAEVEQMIAAARPGLDAYIDCSTAFYDDLSITLARFRVEALGSDEPTFVELSEALAVLDG